MEQNISTATIRLKRDLNWARRQVRLLGSLAGFATATNRDFANTTFDILQASRLLGTPVNLEFILVHQESPPVRQRLLVVMTQVLEEVPSLESLVPYEKALDEARSKGFSVESSFRTSTSPGSAGDDPTIRTGLSITLNQDAIDPEVASQWNTILASGSADSALAISQQSMGQLARSLAEANARGADLEQELSSLKKLNETLELLSLVASKTDNGVVITNRKGVIDWANHSFERLVDLQLQDLVGQSLVQLVEQLIVQYHAESQMGVRELHGAIRLGIAFHATLPFASDSTNLDSTRLDPTNSAETRWVSMNVTPVFDDRGTVTRWIAMATDVTQQREQQEMLELARKRAEQASKLKGDFLANISHEIRTPMNAIVGMTELLLDTTLDQNQHEYAAIVHDSSASLLQLLNDVLDLSKIEAGQLVIHEAEFSLRKTVHSVAATFRLQADRSETKLKCEIDDNVPDRLAGDPVRLRQILMNLVGNAVKFTEFGDVTINVTQVPFTEPIVATASDGRERESEEANYNPAGEPDAILAQAGTLRNDIVRLRFQVTDTGIGITKEAMQRIFEPFMQAASDTAHEFGGTGLGLAICIELARLMDGRLWAESEPKIGSRFFFECNFNPTSAATDSTEALSLTSDEVATIADNADALRILVADDNGANRLLLRRILEKCNHFVDEAVDGAQAVAMVQARAYDLLLLDIRMPNVDGVQATEQILSMCDSLSNVPKIVAVTANARPEDRQRYLAAGMDDFLPKPISARDLMAMVGTTVTEVVDSAKDGVGSNTDANMLLEQRGRERFDAFSPGAKVTKCDLLAQRFAKPLERMENDVEMLREQMELFLEDAPMVIAQLDSALKAADTRLAKLLAHRLKGMASSLDATKLAESAAYIEFNSDSVRTSDRSICLARLSALYDEVEVEIRSYLQN